MICEWVLSAQSTRSSLDRRQMQGHRSSPSLQPRDCNHATLLTEEKVSVSLEIHIKSSFFLLRVVNHRNASCSCRQTFGNKSVWVCVCVCVNHSVMSDSLWPQGLYPARLLCPWNSPGKITGVGCYSLLQGNFWTQEKNLGLLNYKWILYNLSHQGSPTRVYLYSNIKPLKRQHKQ